MTDPTVHVVTDQPETPAPKRRFNYKKLLKAALIATGVGAVVLLLKKLFTARAEGELNVTVETNNNES